MKILTDQLNANTLSWDVLGVDLGMSLKSMYRSVLILKSQEKRFYQLCS